MGSVELDIDPAQSARGDLPLLALSSDVSNAGMLTESPMEIAADVSVALLQCNGGGFVTLLEHEQPVEVSDQAVSFALPLEPPRPAR